ncbi:hypothetical protein CPB83DRAFT_902463 [Crepidotus variabilis]|uniref:Uncharacterized protein n=1 Tax=Crepidotus variabilis TaxID=179855 RepID=A0A9P6ER64_9AGAR|nr:hypothetical protein CPB83DRAFT_902463 [Crepidotus variabilis]
MHDTTQTPTDLNATGEAALPLQEAVTTSPLDGSKAAHLIPTSAISLADRKFPVKPSLVLRSPTTGNILQNLSLNFSYNREMRTSGDIFIPPSDKLSTKHPNAILLATATEQVFLAEQTLILARKQENSLQAEDLDHSLDSTSSRRLETVLQLDILLAAAGYPRIFSARPTFSTQGNLSRNTLVVSNQNSENYYSSEPSGDGSSHMSVGDNDDDEISTSLSVWAPVVSRSEAVLFVRQQVYEGA